MAKVGFDVSQFVGPFRGNIAESIGWGMDASQARARSNTDFLQSLLQADLERSRLQQADRLAKERAQLLQSKYADLAARGDARLQLDRDKFQASRTDYQRQNDAQLVDRVGLAFAAGDENALVREIAKGRALDPTIEAQLPGEGRGLRVGRGVDTLYEGDPNEVQGRERSIAVGPFDPLLGGPFGSSYQLGRGTAEAAAGRGMTGRDALKLGMDVAEDDQSATAAQQRAQTMVGQRSQGLDMQRQGQDLAVRKFKEDAISKSISHAETSLALKEPNKAMASLDQGARLLGSNIGLADKIAAVNQLRSVMSGVLSDQDMNLYFGATGKLTQLEQAMNNLGGRGELPAEFKRQMGIVMNEMMSVAQARVMEGARLARDSVYAKHQVPWDSYEELVRAGDQAQSAISRRLYTPEQFRLEVARVKELFPGRFSGGGAPKDFATQFRGGSGSMDNLGSTAPSNAPARGVPPIPQDTPMPAADPDQEIRDLLKEFDNGTAP